VSERFYGRGLGFPLRLGAPTIDEHRGLGESAGEAKVAESIQIILGTQYGERLMRPRFGCNLKSLVFAPNDSATANLARYYVTEGLARWEPRIEVLEVSVANDVARARLLIEINYRLRVTGAVQSLTYPFPLERPR
jgi:phage baseplate assembly protein W